MRKRSARACVLLGLVSLACGPVDGAPFGEEASIDSVSQAVVDQPLYSANEPSVAVNPLNPANIAVGVHSFIQVSTDGGQTWTTPRGANLPAGVGLNGDPSVAFDSTGQLFFTHLGSLDVYIQKVNPTTGVPIGNAVNISAQGGLPTGTSDKEWLAADWFPGSPNKDNLYVAFLGSGGAYYFSRSTDGGANWSATPVVVSDAVDANIRMIHTAVGADGAVYVAYHSAPSSAPNNENPSGTTGKIIVKRSDDGGLTFPAANKFTAFAAGQADMSYNFQYLCTSPGPGNTCLAGTPNVPRKLFQNQNIMIGSAQPFIVPDPTNAQRLAIIAADDPTNTNHGAGFDDAGVYIVRSTNRGQNWTTPAQVDAGPGTSLQMMPTAGWDLNSRCMAVSYYDTRNGTLNTNGNTMLDLFVRGSTDGGITWGPEIQVNDTLFDPDLNAPGIWVPSPPLPANYVYTRRIGEYNGITVAHGIAHFDFANNDSGGNQRSYYDNVRVCPDAKLPPPTGNVLAARQSTNITALFAVGNDGALYRRYVSGAGAWQGPAAITSTGFAPPGAPLAAIKPTATELDVFVVGNDGRVYRAYEQNDGPWQVTSLSGTNFATPGAHLATGVQNVLQSDVFVVDTAGTLQAFASYAGLPWSGNIPIAANFAPSGASLAAARHPGANQLDVYAIGSSGALTATWVIGAGAWTLPIPITLPGVAVPGAPVATGMQGTSQLDVFFMGTNGALNVGWFVNGSPLFGPVAMSSAGFAPSTAEISTLQHGTSWLDVFVVDTDGAVNQFQAFSVFPWAGPIAVTGDGMAPAGASTTSTTQGTSGLDLFANGNVYLLEATSTTTNSSWSGTVPLLP